MRTAKFVCVRSKHSSIRGCFKFVFDYFAEREKFAEVIEKEIVEVRQQKRLIELLKSGTQLPEIPSS